MSEASTLWIRHGCQHQSSSYFETYSLGICNEINSSLLRQGGNGQSGFIDKLARHMLNGQFKALHSRP